MCLYYSPQSTGNVRRQFNKQAHLPKHLRKITCFKSLRTNNRSATVSIISPIYGHIWNNPWKIGWMKSDREKLSVMQDGKDFISASLHKSVNRGIHVYLSSADLEFDKKTRCLKVWCYEKDFVGAGDREAVFAKVFVTKEHWNEFCHTNDVNTDLTTGTSSNVANN